MGNFGGDTDLPVNFDFASDLGAPAVLVAALIRTGTGQRNRPLKLINNPKHTAFICPA